MSGARVKDQKPYIEVKDAIVARSGIYIYTRQEILDRGHKPVQDKAFYREYRPPAVIARAAPLFDLVPVPNQEHTEEDITADNFHDLASGIVGGPISIVPMPDGVEIGLQGRIAFFTREAYNYYLEGNKETSADYTSKSVLVDNPDEVGYDLIMTEIISVNNVAITQRGRGGKDVRVKDSDIPVSAVIDAILNRRNDTMSILTKLLGLDKPQEKPFSAVVRDSLTRFGTLSAQDREKEVEAVLAQVTQFSDSPLRSSLIGVVRDSYIHADEVLAKWKDSEKIIDGLFARCTDSEDQLAASIQDKDEKPAESEEDEDDEGEDKKKEKKDEKVSDKKDTAALLDEKIAELRDALPGMIDASVSKILAAAAGGRQEGPSLDAHRNTDSAGADDIDYESYAVGAFGQR